MILSVKSNDMMLVIYVSSLIRSILALHKLIDNKETRIWNEKETIKATVRFWIDMNYLFMTNICGNIIILNQDKWYNTFMWPCVKFRRKKKLRRKQLARRRRRRRNRRIKNPPFLIQRADPDLVIHHIASVNSDCVLFHVTHCKP